MNKIKRVSLYFRVLFQIVFCLLFLQVLGVGISWVNAPHTLAFLNGNIVFSLPNYPVLHPLSFTTKLLGFLLSMIPIGISMVVVYFLVKLFQLYEQGEIFLLKNVTYIRNIGYTLLVGQLFNPVYGALMSLLLTWSNPPHHRLMQVSVDGTNVGILLTSILVILISWIMAEGHKLLEEHELTV